MDRAYGFFNNQFKGCAVENCLQMLELIGEISSEQREIREKATSTLDRQLLTLLQLPL